MFLVGKSNPLTIYLKLDKVCLADKVNKGGGLSLYCLNQVHSQIHPVHSSFQIFPCIIIHVLEGKINPLTIYLELNKVCLADKVNKGGCLFTYPQLSASKNTPCTSFQIFPCIIIHVFGRKNSSRDNLSLARQSVLSRQGK